MAKLIYSALTPLDGFVTDETGNLEHLNERRFDHGVVYVRYRAKS